MCGRETRWGSESLEGEFGNFVLMGMLTQWDLLEYNSLNPMTVFLW